MKKNALMQPLGSDEEIKKFVLKKLQDYSAIPALSEHEDQMLSFLKTDFDRKDWYELKVNGVTEFCYLQQDLACPDYFFTVHTDRVPSFSRGNRSAFTNTIVDQGEVLQGQLDDIIGISVLCYLHSLNYPMNILFTAKEEYCISWKQLHQTILAFSDSLVLPMKPISIDIDIFPSLSSFKDGQVTLRSFDNCGSMDPILVSLLRHCASKVTVPYFKDSIGTAIVEPGFLAQHTDGVFKGAHIGIPLINYHTDKEQTYWLVVYHIVKLIQRFLLDTITTGEQTCRH